MNVGLFALRVVVGALFIGHGTQKLFGWFGGHGIEGTGGFMEQLGYRPGKSFAVLGGVAEAGGGALFVLGFLTPFAALAVIAMMINAVFAVHIDNGLWIQDNGYEYPLVVAVAAAALALAGGGSLSVDHILGLNLGGFIGFLAILLGVIAGGISAGIRQPEPAEPAAEGEREAHVRKAA
jgi:putative oxidoreductase